MNIINLYGSLEGQTAKIADYITQLLRKKGINVTTLALDRLPKYFTLEKYDAAVIGAPIHMGNYPRYVKKFVSQNHDQLNSMTSAFYSVCMAIHSQNTNSRQAAAVYIDKFIQQSHWQPQLTATFAGAVKYTQYNVITRFIMKRISQKEGGSTDTSVDHEYTDWESVTRFIENFLEKASIPQIA